MQFKIKGREGKLTYTLKQLLAEKPDGVYVNITRSDDVVIISRGRVVNLDGDSQELILEDDLKKCGPSSYHKTHTPITLEITP